MEFSRKSNLLLSTHTIHTEPGNNRTLTLLAHYLLLNPKIDREVNNPSKMLQISNKPIKQKVDFLLNLIKSTINVNLMQQSIITTIR